MIDGCGFSCEIVLRWITLEWPDFTDDKPTMVQVMAWWCQATNHYLNQCLPSSLSPYGVTAFVLTRLCRVPSSAGKLVNTKHHRHYISRNFHDDVIKWKHFPRNWPFVRGIHRSPVNSPHEGQWRGASMCPLICVLINDWVNNREAGDLRSQRTHYDVSVMHRVRSPMSVIVVQQGFILPISFRITSLALIQSYNYPNDSVATMENESMHHT